MESSVVMRIPLPGVRWIAMPHAIDERGVLTAVEGNSDIPFEIKRMFYMHRTPAGVERGGHAHRNTHQVVIPVSGRFVMDISDGSETRTVELSDPNKGLYMPPMTWVRLYAFSPDAVALVLADTHYDRSQSLRTWDDFMRAVTQMRQISR